MNAFGWIIIGALIGIIAMRIRDDNEISEACNERDMYQRMNSALLDINYALRQKINKLLEIGNE